MFGQSAHRRAPGFTLPDTRMEFHDLADYRGKVVLLEIMQSGCPSCQTLSKTLNTLKHNYGDKVAILHVVNPPDNRNTVTAFAQQFGVTSPILFDCGQMAASYLKPDPANPQIHLPHLFVIDQRGYIREHYDESRRDMFEGDGLAAVVERLLTEKR